MRCTPAVLATALVTIVALTSCSDPNAPGALVAIRFRTGSSVVSAARAGSPLSFSLMNGVQDVVVTGSNGTLTITDIRLIVDELELEGAEAGDCPDDGEQQAGCEEIEIGPLAAQVPVNGQPVTVASDAIPPGSYTELEFEVEDLEVDGDEGDDAGDATALEALLATLRQTYADWPAGASGGGGDAHADRRRGGPSRLLRPRSRSSSQPLRRVAWRPTRASRWTSIPINGLEPDGTVRDLSCSTSRTSEIVEFEPRSRTDWVSR
jgi:hypothetical protein